MKRRVISRISAIILALALLFSYAFAEVRVEDNRATDGDVEVYFGEWYYTPDEVALYLHAFQELPDNYITEDEAEDAGWVSSRGNLWDVFYGACLGGDVYQNRERLLPRDKTYEKCDVNYFGAYRGAERLVYSYDGYIYYTEDHYQSFEPLYEGWYEEEEEQGFFASLFDLLF